jgi:hypothetical protein
MFNLDWPELSKQLLIFILGLISGSLLIYLRFRYTRRIEENKLKRRIHLELNNLYTKEGLQILLHVANTGQRPVTLVEAGLLFDAQDFPRALTLVNWEIPKKLNDGDVYTYEFDLNEIPTGKGLSWSELNYGWVKNSAGEMYGIAREKPRHMTEETNNELDQT